MNEPNSNFNLEIQNLRVSMNVLHKQKKTKSLWKRRLLIAATAMIFVLILAAALLYVIRGPTTNSKAFSIDILIHIKPLPQKDPQPEDRLEQSVHSPEAKSAVFSSSTEHIGDKPPCKTCHRHARHMTFSAASQKSEAVFLHRQ